MDEFIAYRYSQVMTPYLATPRMYLRKLTSADHDEIMDLDSDPEVMEYLTSGRASSHEEVAAVLKRTQLLYEKYQYRFGVWAAIERSSERFIGWFLLRPCKKDPDNVSVIELGYRFKKAFWGKGYATEGSLLLIEKAFRELDVKEVFATTMKENVKSQNVMKKIGLVFDCEYQELDFPGTNKTAVRYCLRRENN